MLLLSSVFLIGYTQPKEYRYSVTHMKICEFTRNISLYEAETDINKFCTPYISLDSGYVGLSILPFTIAIEQPGNDLVSMLLLDEESKRSTYYDNDFKVRFKKLPARDPNNKRCIVYLSELPIPELYNSKICIVRWEDKIIYQILKPLKL